MGVAGAAVSSAERAPRIWPSCAPTWGQNVLPSPGRIGTVQAIGLPSSTVTVVPARTAPPTNRRLRFARSQRQVVAELSFGLRSLVRPPRAADERDVWALSDRAAQAAAAAALKRLPS